MPQPIKGQMPPQYNKRIQAPNPVEALGRRIAVLEEQVARLEAIVGDMLLASTQPEPAVAAPEENDAPADGAKKPSTRTRSRSKTTGSI